MGRDIQAELTLSSGEVVVAQLPREQIDYHQLKTGDQLHITSRETRTFVPDYAI
jgi:sulfate transport system ATP-binding protein